MILLLSDLLLLLTLLNKRKILKYNENRPYTENKTKQNKPKNYFIALSRRWKSLMF